MSYYQEDPTKGCKIMLLVLMLILLVAAITTLELMGVERAPTNRSELCSCVIHVDSVRKPITEEV